MTDKDIFRFCRSCGSTNIKPTHDDDEGNQQWQCEECCASWKQIKYQTQQDESEFVTSDLKDGSSIIH